jgi:DNA-directed RNA polymerase subunit alpha
MEALWPGYGVTIGNSLRRVLLSSLPGAAVTQVKIKGVQHEFSTIAGVREDIVTILLNLKQLRFKLYADEPQKATLSVKGEKDVTGADLELPTQVELVNPEAPIAALTDKKAEFELEITVERGMGYAPAETLKKGKLEIGTIVIDAIFTPIKKVSYRVENMRVGERTDYDRLVLELETDGTISPEEAFSSASEILVKHFTLINEAFKSQPAEPVLPPKKHEKKKKGKKTK